MRKLWRRRTEATTEQLIATGASNSYPDPIDGDLGYRPVGGGSRQLPPWTRERAIAASVAGYRANPMARAIIDTYTAFCVGDSGLTLQCSNDDVREVAERFWNDPANMLGEQDIMLRSHLIPGESVYEMMVGEISGVTQRSPIDPSRIRDVAFERGNALWPGELTIGNPGGLTSSTLSVIRLDPFTELRDGDAFFWRSFRTLETDVRGAPFLMPVLDWLDNYDTVLSNLIDRTALARYFVWDVTLKGTTADGQQWTQNEINKWVAGRGGHAAPMSGTVEAHNENVEWNVKNAEAGAYEDKVTGGMVLTSVAAGSGLSKPWLAEPEDANRATSLTMAEPVRRRVGGVQNVWLGYMTELVRFAVDKAVARGQLDSMVTVSAEAGTTKQVPASQTVSVTGPEVAAADAEVTAKVLVNLAQALDKLVARGLLSQEAGEVAAQKAWEGFTGVPFDPKLGKGDADESAIADRVDDADTTGAPITQLISA